VTAATDSRAEVVKLTRVLGLDSPDALAALLSVPAPELAAYRDNVVALLHDDDLALLRRMASAAPLLPTALLATVGERALGPLICARMVELIEPQLAAEIAGHMSTEFLAPLAAALDPRCAGGVISLLDPQRLGEIAVAMAAEGEHVPMATAIDCLDQEALAACISHLDDPDLLQVAFVIEQKQRLAGLAEIVGIERVQRILDGANARGLGPEAVGLLEHLTAAQRSQLRAEAPVTSPGV
jgi:hypothetical protein